MGLLQETPNLMTEDEAADYLRVSARTLRRWREDGTDEGPAWVRLGPKMVRYTRATLDMWLSSREWGGGQV
jgi:excisionase family DNA binding protein